MFAYIRTNEEYLEAISILTLSEELALDTETYALPEWKNKGSALDPHTGRISLIILKGRDTIPYVLDVLWLQHECVDFSLLEDLLLSRDWLLMHNTRFDLKFILSTFGYMPENVRDTLIMAKLCTNATGSKVAKQQGHGYADLCRDYLDVHIAGKKSLRESTWLIGLNSRNLENEWWLEKLSYAARDTEYLFPLHDIMYKVLTTPLPDSLLTKTGNTSGEWGLGMEEVMHREFEYIPLVAMKEYVGLPVSDRMLQIIQDSCDRQMYAVAVELSKDFNLDAPKPDWDGVLMPSKKALEILRSSTKLLECIQEAVKFKALDNVQAAVLKRTLDIIEILSTPPGEDEEGNIIMKEVQWVDEDEELLYQELKEIEHSALLEACPLMRRVLDFKRLVKQSAMDLRKFINPVTNRIHSSIDQLGTSTGRQAYSRPNLQQVSGRVQIEIEIEISELFRL